MHTITSTIARVGVLLKEDSQYTLEGVVYVISLVVLRLRLATFGVYHIHHKSILNVHHCGRLSDVNILTGPVEVRNAEVTLCM